MKHNDSIRHIYQDSSRSTQERVEDLLSQMTLAEKLAQIGSVYIYELIEDGNFSEKKAAQWFENGMGQITRLGGASPFAPQQRARLANHIQTFLTRKTRLGIPAIIHEECCSGFTALEATRFPQMIGLASTWNPELGEQMGTVIHQQMRATGSHQGLAPVLDVLRDPRWGRCEETFGEDPLLVSRMGVAVVRGLQGQDLKQGIIATGKHFAAYSAPEGGLNCTPVHVGMHEFHDVYLLPFEAAIHDAKIASMMNSYSELDGQVVAASRAIMTDLLRDKLRFDGVVVSDYDAVKMIQTHHRMAASLEEAAALALKAGIDVELPSSLCYAEPLLQALQYGQISLADIDVAVKRLLQKKFELGLFEDPFIDEKGCTSFYHQASQGTLARRIAEESLVLLKNDGKLLPLSKETGCIAVIGPNAAASRNMLGDYSYSAAMEHLLSMNQDANNTYAHLNPRAVLEDSNNEIPTIIDVIKRRVAPGTRVLYAAGCDLNSTDRSGFDQAIAAVQEADVTILVLGDRSGLTPDCTSGEFRDSADLILPGVQQELVQAVAATGKPLVAVLINGRVLSLSQLVEYVPAVLEAWLPGEEGAEAVVAALFGDINPGGKLPVSLPRSVGQVPIFYNQKSSGGRSFIHGDYVSLSTKPLFPFGHGLSYTQFEYSGLTISPVCVKPGDEVRISLSVSNSGSLPGEEVVQLYLCDEYACVPRPVKELKGFQRISLQPGESRRLTFVLPTSMLAFINTDLELVLEPGDFMVMLGGSSQDIRLEGKFKLEGTVRYINASRTILCPVEIV